MTEFKLGARRSITGYPPLSPSDEDFANMSDLQRQILKLVCENKDVDYRTLSKSTKKDRVTVLQSVKTLGGKRLIRPIKVDPKNPSSRLVFYPTDRGLAFGIIYLRTDYNRHRLNYGLELLSRFDTIIPRVGIEPVALRHTAIGLIDSTIFDENGELEPLNKGQRKDFILALIRGALAQYLIVGGAIDVLVKCQNELGKVQDIGSPNGAAKAIEILKMKEILK